MGPLNSVGGLDPFKVLATPDYINILQLTFHTCTIANLSSYKQKTFCIYLKPVAWALGGSLSAEEPLSQIKGPLFCLKK